MANATSTNSCREHRDFILERNSKCDEMVKPDKRPLAIDHWQAAFYEDFIRWFHVKREAGVVQIEDPQIESLVESSGRVPRETHSLGCCGCGKLQTWGSSHHLTTRTDASEMVVRVDEYASAGADGALFSAVGGRV